MVLWRCHGCGNSWEAHGQPGFRETCPHCEAYLHCCLNCGLYDEHAHNKCKSPTTDWVADREKLNRCEEFQMRRKEAAGPKGKTGKEARGMWDELWKKGEK